jgi:PleD family two-component response regulator
MSEILFADDDDALRTMVSELLRAAGHSVRTAADGAAALAEIRARPPELAILDYRMGEPDGFAVCRAVKDDPRIAWLPVLILTGEGSLEDRLGGFDAGADDYLSKPFDNRELLARATALLRQSRLGRDRNPTTGLPGGESIYAEIGRRLSAGAPFSVCYFDLDHFKPFSDRFGFAVADAAIREAGQAVSLAAQGRVGFVGHVGGDDFVVVCPPDAAHMIAEEAQARFAEGLLKHVPHDVVEAGAYRATDRYGEERDFPLTRLSAAVLRIDPARWTSFDHLGERVAALKALAKGDEGRGIAEGELAG